MTDKSLSFHRKVIWLIAGIGGAQAITMLSAPVLTRLYSPNAFGQYGIYLGIVSIGSVLVTLRYERSLIIATSSSARHGIFAVLLTLSVMGLLGGSAFGLWYYIAHQEPVTMLVGLIWAFALALALTFEGLALTGRFLALKEQGYRLISSVRLGSRGIQATIQVTVGALAGGWALGLPIGSLIGLGFSATYFGWLAWRRGWIDFRRYKLQLRRMLAAARRYSEFPRYMSPSAISNSTTPQLMVLIVGSLLSPAESGYVFLAQRIIKAPMSLLGGTISDANFEDVSELSRERIRRTYIRRVRRLALLGIIPFSALVLFGPVLFEIVFGQEWRDAGVVAQILAPGLFVQFIFSPFCSLFTVLRRLDMYLRWSVARMLLIAGLVWLGTVQLGTYGAAAAYSAATALAFMAIHVMLQRILSVSKPPERG